MKRMIIPLSFLLVFLLPCLLFNNVGKRMQQNNPIDEFVTTTATEYSNTKMIIQVMDHQQIRQMDFDDYILGVLIGEMPAEFEIEALKAQAVATRTYTLQKILFQGKHSDALVCTDSTCCQAFRTVEEYMYTGGTMESIERMKRAISETENMVLTYCDELIEATYFSCCGGKTEDAIAVWGSDVPYLKSVSSPGEESSRHYISEYRFTMKDFLEKLNLDPLCDINETDIQLTYTNGGGVDNCYIQKHCFSGTQMRTLLQIPSTCFELFITDGTVTIKVKGNGHRVGLSQYGAEAMALTGKKFDEILTHYYQGAELTVLTDDQMNTIFDKAWNL